MSTLLVPFRRLRPLFVLAGLAAVSASAQIFVGSDNFESGSGKWSFEFRLDGSNGNGQLTFSGTRLDFTKDAGFGSHLRAWDGDPLTGASRTAASYATSWTATLQVTNTLSVASGQWANIGFEVSDGSSYSAIMLAAENSGSQFRSEGSGFTTVTGAATGNTGVWLQLNWDAAAKVLTTGYSYDGATFQVHSTQTPLTQWSGTTLASSGFYFEVFGTSNTAAAITAGALSADNFSITAVPEPSTYAALAGAAALGLALWRRRRAAA